MRVTSTHILLIVVHHPRQRGTLCSREEPIESSFLLGKTLASHANEKKNGMAVAFRRRFGNKTPETARDLTLICANRSCKSPNPGFQTKHFCVFGVL